MKTKKILAVILCVCLIAAGCGRKNGDTGIHDLSDNTRQENTKRESTETTDQTGNDTISEKNRKDTPQFLKLNNKWSKATFAGNAKSDYRPVVVEPRTEPYEIKEDLSNVENIDQFSGFTDEQKKMLAGNGFIVLPGDNTRMNTVYDINAYFKVPNFITSDSVLHLYHQFYNKSLMFVENEYLYGYLDRLTGQMLDKSIRLMDYLKDEELKSLQEKNIVYFLVARMLALSTTDIDINVKASLYNTAKEEYELVEKAEGYGLSPLFGFGIDYSQFKIRGHYTFSENMGRYFKTMMWFGIAPLPFIDDEGNMIYGNIYQALLMSYTTFLDTDDICGAELWDNIYKPTAQYVGVSDDINVFVMNGLRLAVYGDMEDPNIFNDEEYKDELAKAVLNLPEPQIQGKYVAVSTQAGKQFRYMGQRYVMDAYILQELTDPYSRPLPSALDVMGVFGSKYAEALMFNHYKPQETWPEYEENFYKLREKMDSYGADTWEENLYNGWLWAIAECLKEYDKDSGMPFFMTNDAWKAKTLNTALGSYTELKHDTVLYGKQVAAEGGDGEIMDIDAHYVEPNINLYGKLLYLTEYTVQILKEKNMLSHMLESASESYINLLKLLIECSSKELRNEKLTEEEYDSLYSYGAWMENIYKTLAYNLSDEDVEMTDLVVADIASNPGRYLSLGTGFFDYIYVVVEIDDKLYLTRGAVYSAYEFVSDERLTDEEWWELNGIKIIREKTANDSGLTYDYPVFTEVSEHRSEQPDWVKKFKSYENNVSIKKIEVGW